MKTNDLSDYQLYQLAQNKSLASTIRAAADKELAKRELSVEKVEIIKLSQTLQFPNENPDPLKSSYKWLLVLSPFFTGIHSLIAGRLLAKGQSHKWNDYWKYVCLGFRLWTILILLYVWFDSFGKG